MEREIQAKITEYQRTYRSKCLEIASNAEDAMLNIWNLEDFAKAYEHCVSSQMLEKAKKLYDEAKAKMIGLSSAMTSSEMADFGKAFEMVYPLHVVDPNKHRNEIYNWKLPDRERLVSEYLDGLGENIFEQTEEELIKGTWKAVCPIEFKPEYA